MNRRISFHSWHAIRKFASAALVTFMLVFTAGVTFILGILSPWVELSTATFRTVMLVSVSVIVSFLLVERVVVHRAAALAEMGAVRGAFHQADEVHLAASQVLIQSTPTSAEDQVICVSALPGHNGIKRRPEKSAIGVNLFMQKLVERATTSPGWRIRHLLNFNSLEDFDNWLRLEEKLAGAPKYEARAYLTSTSLPILAPLIVANEHVLLANEDPQEARLRSAVHFQGRNVAVWATTYFDDLWEGAPFLLRSQRGRHVPAIEAVRRQLGTSTG